MKEEKFSNLTKREKAIVNKYIFKACYIVESCDGVMSEKDRLWLSEYIKEKLLFKSLTERKEK